MKHDSYKSSQKKKVKTKATDGEYETILKESMTRGDIEVKKLLDKLKEPGTVPHKPSKLQKSDAPVVDVVIDNLENKRYEKCGCDKCKEIEKKLKALAKDPKIRAKIDELLKEIKISD